MLGDYLTSKEVSEELSVTYRHLWTYRKRGLVPMPDMYIGSKPLWSRELIDSWKADKQDIETVEEYLQ